MSLALLRAARIVALKDSQPFRRSVFEYLAARRPMVRGVRGTWRLLRRTPAGAAMICAYGARAYLGVRWPESDAPVIAVAAYRNEERQFAWLAALPGAPDIARVDISAGALLSADALAALSRVRWRGLSLLYAEARRSGRRGDFLVACRLAATLGFYLRFVDELDRAPARAVLVSSDSNPYAMALVAAAERLGRRTVYITHGHLPEGPPPARFDLSLVDGPAVVDVYRRAFGLEGRVVYKGSEGAFGPLRAAALDPSPTRVGVFMSLIVDWDAFATLVPRLRARFPGATIHVRLHPNRTIRDPRAVAILEGLEGVTVSEGAAPMAEDAARCDFVLAGNTSSHLTLLRLGVPTAYVPGLDLVPHDFYRLLAERVVPEFASPEAIDPAHIRTHYTAPDWPERFARFDASYPDKAPCADVVGALREVIA